MGYRGVYTRAQRRLYNKIADHGTRIYKLQKNFESITERMKNIEKENTALFEELKELDQEGIFKGMEDKEVKKII